MGKQKQGVTKKFAAVKRMISPKDSRIQKPVLNPNLVEKLAKKQKDTVNNVVNTPSSLFFSHNESLGPPHRCGFLSVGQKALPRCAWLLIHLAAWARRSSRDHTHRR